MTEGSIKINGTFERLVMSIVAGLLIISVAANVTQAIAFGKVQNDISWIKEIVTETRASTRVNDDRIDDHDRRLDRLERDQAVHGGNNRS